MKDGVQIGQSELDKEKQEDGALLLHQQLTQQATIRKEILMGQWLVIHERMKVGVEVGQSELDKEKQEDGALLLYQQLTQQATIRKGILKGSGS